MSVFNYKYDITVLELLRSRLDTLITSAIEANNEDNINASIAEINTQVKEFVEETNSIFICGFPLVVD